MKLRNNTKKKFKKKTRQVNLLLKYDFINGLESKRILSSYKGMLMYGSKDAIGLMQLVESTAKDVAKKVDVQLTDDELKEKLLEPEININLGTKYLSILIERYQNIEIAVTAYNAGIGTVDNWIEKGIIKSDGSDIENIPYKETNNYVRKILRDYKIYANL